MQNTLLLNPVPPFDFALTVGIFRQSSSNVPDYLVANNYRRALDYLDDTLLIEVSPFGTVDQPVIKVNLLSPQKKPLPSALVDKIKWIFSVDFDLTPFYELLDRNLETQSLKQRLFGLKPPRLPSTFEALVSGIIEQQISMAAASTLKTRLVRSCGKAVFFEDQEYLSFPSPRKIASLSIAELRRVGLSPRKAIAVKTVSELIASGGLEFLEEGQLSTDKVFQELCGIKGIGPWTVKYMLCRGLGNYNVIPVEDIALQQGMRQYYGGNRIQSKTDVFEILSEFGQYSGYAAFYFITSYVYERYSPRIL